MEEKKSFWKTPRGKALIKLGLWSIFFLFIIVFSLLSTPNEINNEEETVNRFSLYNDMLDELLINNYEYEYTINIGEDTIIYNGKCDGKNNEGIKESKDGIVKYFINEENTYRVVLNNLEVYDILYSEINENYVNIKILFDNLKSVSYRTEKEETNRKIIYDTVGYSVVVNTNLENIESIEIEENENIYNLEFNNIGSIEEIVFN